MRPTVTVLILAFLATASVRGAEGSTVLVGSLEYVEGKGPTEFKRDRAFYAHENLQFLVVRVDRVLAGAPASDQLLVGVEVDHPGTPTVQWLSPDYGVLDPEIWKRGSRVVVAIPPSAPGSGPCSPPRWLFELDVPRPKGADPKAPVVYMDEGLRRFQGLPVVCLSVGDVFLVRE